MIRRATAADSQRIADELWRNWHQLKARQLGSVPREYSSSEVLAAKIGGELDRWLVCESSDPKQLGFFFCSNLGANQIFKRYRFPERSLHIEKFACLLPSEVILEHLRLLAAHFPNESILLCLPTPLRAAYWAGLKAGFKLLGESPMILGTSAWLYLDREKRFEEIQTKLRRAKLIVPEPDSSPRGNRVTRARQ